MQADLQKWELAIRNYEPFKETSKEIIWEPNQ
jgi:hypothetical protein